MFTDIWICREKRYRRRYGQCNIKVLEGVLENMYFIIVHKKIKSPETVEFQGFSFGGDKRDRTADLLNAIQALSQLSYTPKY